MKAVKWFLLMSALAMTLSAFAQFGGDMGPGPGGPPPGEGGPPPGEAGPPPDGLGAPTDQTNGTARRPPAPPSVDDQLKQLTKTLKLTDSQQTKVRSALQAQQTQMQDLFQNESLSRSEKRSQMKSIHESTTSSIRALLNASQQKKFDELEQKRQQKMPEHHPTQNGSGS
jgi:hypothetical protein